jgi:hypothetical protein
MKYLRHASRCVPVLVGILLLASAPAARAQQIPPGCTGTGVSINISVFFADGVTGALGTPVNECETLVYVATIAYNPNGNNCAFQDGALIITTADGVEHDVTPAGGIRGPINGGPLTVGDAGPVVGVPLNYVVDPADVVGGQITAVASYNVSNNFPKGVTFIGPPGGVAGVSQASTSVPVDVQACPTTFCAPQVCDPAATDPVNFPGRQGLCEAGTPPLCPLPAGVDPNCFEPFCDLATDACSSKPIVPTPAVCSTSNCGNRGRIVARNAPSLDMLGFALRSLSLVFVDPSNQDVSVQISNANGVCYSATLPAGSLVLKGNYYRYINAHAKNAPGGIKKMTIWERRGQTQIYADAYGDLSACTLPDMTTNVSIGNTVFTHVGTWIQTSSGWRLPLSAAQ